ncbi:MAG TPA: amino acid adenylation domain-containing protein [Pyrinomonadaceae bacterium]|nr:amino acid adenylation domain-containing protein [Pyrinomonadaceae bacterium]
MQSSTSHGFRLSPQQRQIWISQQAFPSQPLRVACSFDVTGRLDRDRLRQALKIVVGRHEILRTTFARPAGIKTPFQVISEEAKFFWREVDQQVDAIFSAECKEPLMLDRGPVVRCHVVKLSSDRAVLLLSLPAICADSQTVFNLAGELFRVYESGAESGADEVAQYADFAEWENELLESDDEQALKKKAFWKQRQGQSVPVLPLEQRAMAEQPPEYSEVILDLSDVALDTDTAVSDLLFATWQSLISRLSGQRDFTIYRLCDARKGEDLRDALGPYQRYLPIKYHLENELRQATDSLEYFEPNDEGLLSGRAIAFEFEEQPHWTTETLSVSLANQFAFLNPFKLKLSCRQTDERLSLQLQYDCRVFHRETCERFVGYLQRLIEALANTTRATRAQLKLDAIDILPASERERLLVHWNETASAYSHEKSVHHFFEEQARKTPAQPAVVCGNQQLSYEELNSRANQLAHLLIGPGVAPNARVGMCLSPSVNTIVALLGILKAGAAYVPLNPEHPSARLNAQLVKSEANICLTNVASIAETLSADIRIIHFERDARLLDDLPHTNPAVAVSSDALAYVIYTSGSTGTPKGVAVRHRNLVNYTQFMLDRMRIEAPLHFATVSTISADLGNTCIFPSLFSGGCLHILPAEVVLESRLFRDYFQQHAIDVLKIAPSHIQALLADGNEREMLPLRYLILGGEAFTRQLLDTILASSPRCKILNHYGPTETTVGSLTFDASEQKLSDTARTVPIGRPIANTRVYILDKYMNPCPTGVAGELYIGGAGVAAGYINDPDQTAARFVPDIFSTDLGSRLYRTGDLARYLPDGNVEFLGRSDFQVKVRGYRIELGEIEAALSGHPLIRQSVVLLRQDGGRERLVAYVTGSRLRPANTPEIAEFLTQRLPDYMVPAPIVVLRAFPTTPNGKVDRAALPAPEEAQGVDRVVRPPQTLVEIELAKIWSGLLKMEELSVHDDFFDLGGHSLLATQVVSRVRKTFNKDIPLRSIFDAPTIAKLAGVIESATSADTVDLRMELEAIESLSDEEAERLLEG